MFFSFLFSIASFSGWSRLHSSIIHSSSTSTTMRITTTFDRFVNTSTKIELASFSWNVPGCGLFRRSTSNECKTSQAPKVIIVSIKAPQTIHWCGMQNTRLAHQNIDKTMQSDEYSSICQLGCMTCRQCTVSVKEAGLMQTELTVGPWWTPISKHVWRFLGCLHVNDLAETPFQQTQTLQFSC